MVYLETVHKNLKQYILENNYMGYNPYDVYASDMIYGRFFGRKYISVLFTQLNKISPFNFRKQLGIPKTNSPKAVALIILALIEEGFEKNKSEIEYLINWLLDNKSDTYDQYTIGFFFPISLSMYSSEINHPSLIITLFAIYAFIEYYKYSKSEKVLDAILSFEYLISSKLPVFEDKNELYYSYNFERFNEVYNATAKVGKFYSMLYEINKDSSLLIKIEKILNYLQKNQSEDGSWLYRKGISYSDSFHTAFILEAIYQMRKQVDHPVYTEMFKKGLEDYLKSFILPDGQPLYIHPRYGNKGKRKFFEVTKTDIRDSANAILFLSEINKTDIAQKVYQWTVSNMYDNKKGYFHFYKEKYWKNRIEYIRPQGWMLYASSKLIKVNQNKFL
jgi:hypothetical protein